MNSKSKESITEFIDEQGCIIFDCNQINHTGIHIPFCTNKPATGV